MEIGAIIKQGGACGFTVWAPQKSAISLKLHSSGKKIPLKEITDGYFSVTVEDIEQGSKYSFIIDNDIERPDPASGYQPEGVHGPSQVIDHGSFNWSDEKWTVMPLDKMVIYELHVGTFTESGDFESIIPRLKALKQLGINAIEIMPVSQFPGERNWGYDCTYPFAVQNSYGGPLGLKKLINECHKTGMAVVLDVVYNHLGPEGNYLGDFAPYFTDKYRTPWGQAVNFDDEYSDGVRNYFVKNALFWFDKYHIDALRLDAIHGIYDFGAKHILEELSHKVQELSRHKGRSFYLIAESDLNDTRIIKPKEQGGYGMDAQWSDDFHHCLHTLITGESSGYYEDFGSIAHLKKAYEEGFVYSWTRSRYRKRMHGSSSKEMGPEKFVVFSQNHDQVGNRAFSERLVKLTDFEGLKLVASAVLLSPYIPLIFMGEEYAEDSPFNYFISHHDKELVEAVRKGRKEEFRSFKWDREPPDPYSGETFSASKIQWDKRKKGRHKTMLDLYGFLLGLRNEIPSFGCSGRRDVKARVSDDKKVLIVERRFEGTYTVSVMNFDTDIKEIGTHFEGAKLKRVYDSADERWLGPGSIAQDTIEGACSLKLRPHSFAVYIEEK